MLSDEAFLKVRLNARQTLLDSKAGTAYDEAMTLTAEISAGQLAELIKQVQAGNEVLLTQGSKPVARLLPAFETDTGLCAALQVRSLKGHRVLMPAISQQKLAEEMFARQ